MHWDTLISTLIAGSTAVLGFSGVAGAAADLAIFSSVIFACLAGYDLFRTLVRR